MKETEPSKSWPGWLKRTPLCKRRGFGSAGGWLGRESRPFPLATRSVRLSVLTATAVGYQPVGTKPSTREVAGSEMSTPIALLLSALTTNSVLPSGEMATPLGVLPSGEEG